MSLSGFVPGPLTLAWVALGWIIRLVMIPLVARRHSAANALAWLAPIFLFPVPGTLLYLWLARYGLQRSAERHRHVRARVEADDRLRRQRRHETEEGIQFGHRDLVRLAERLSTREMGGFPILGGNHIELLSESGGMAERLLDDVAAARRHVHLLFFQFIPDETGHRVARALAEAAGRGVRCRVLVDAWASRKMRKSLAPWLRDRGVEVHSVLPMHPLREPLARLDVRNHRKVAVIDGRIGYTGSHNLHDPGHALEHGIWHQISARVEGPTALQLQMLFAEDWYFATDEMLTGDDVFPDPERPGRAAIQAIPGGPSYPAHILQHVLVQAIGEANERLVVTTPYLVPDETVLLALRLAALRGVETRIVVPRRSDRRVADLAARAYFDALLDAGVHVHLHPDGIVHAKTVSVDRALGVVGTANLDRRSLFLNYEDLLLVWDEDCVDALRRAQDALLAGAEEVDRDAWARRPRRDKYVQHTAKLVSPVL